MPKSVLVLGSKPQCTVPDIRFDICYAANGALMRAAEHAPGAHIVSLVSRDYAMAYHAKAQGDLPRMAREHADEVLIVGAFQLQPRARAFKDFAGDRPVSKRTTWRRTRDVVRAIGWAEAKRIADDFGGLAALSWRLALKHELGIWKPSAGFYAALIARDRHGEDIDLHVSGIGLTSDGLYNREAVRGRSHIQIDSLIWRQLVAEGVQFHDIDAAALAPKPPSPQPPSPRPTAPQPTAPEALTDASLTAGADGQA